jgi:hypothetical protein
VDQIIIETVTISLGDTEIVSNNSKLNTTLEGIVNNNLLNPFNSRALANVNAGVVSELFQLIDLTQSNLLNSEVILTNSGDIDPLIGIDTQINNVGLNFFNSAALANTNGAAAVVTTGDLTPVLRADKTNSAVSSINENNKRQYNRRSDRPLCGDQ